MSLKESRKIFERPNKESVGTPKEFRLFKASWSLRESMQWWGNSFETFSIVCKEIQ